jgi:hypothetical protein
MQGSHISYSPDGSRFVDARGHQAVWLSAVSWETRTVFAFVDAELRASLSDVRAGWAVVAV